MKWDTKVTKLLGIKYPMIQRGLSRYSYAKLAAAVSNAGGLGQISVLRYPDEYALGKEIEQLRTKTMKPFGVCFISEYTTRRVDEMLDMVLQKKVPVITISGDNQLDLLDRVQDEMVQTIVAVSTVRQAKKVKTLGADIILITNDQQRKHAKQSNHNLFETIYQMIDQLSIPLLIESSDTDGRYLMAQLALGVDGIVSGKKFIATKDCMQAHVDYKNKQITKNKQSTIVIHGAKISPYEMLKKEWIANIVNGNKNPLEKNKKHPLNDEIFEEYFYHDAKDNSFNLLSQEEVDFAHLPTVKEKIKAMIQEAKEIREKWSTKGLYEQ